MKVVRISTWRAQQAAREALFATEDEETVGSSPRQEGPAGKRDVPGGCLGKELEEKPKQQRLQMLGRRIGLDERGGEKQ